MTSCILSLGLVKGYLSQYCASDDEVDKLKYFDIVDFHASAT